MRNKGFSFAELLIVVAILLIIAAIAIPALTKKRPPVPPPPPPTVIQNRFVHLFTEEHPEQGTYFTEVEVWQDKEHNQEIVCFNGGNGRSACYLTGYSK